MTEENKPHVDFTSLRDLLTVVFKHKYKIVAVFVLVFATSLVLASQVRQSYESKSVLLIKLGREFLNRPESVNSGGSAIPVDSITKSEISILTSHDLIDKVVKNIGATALYPQLNDLPGNTARDSAAQGSFRRNLKVTMLGSTLVEVRFTHAKPQVAAQAVNALVDAFKDKHLEVFGGKSTAFLENQKQVFQDKLRESENKLAGFEEKNRIFSLEDQRTALIEQRATLDTSLRDAQDRVGEAEQKIAFIKSANWTADIPVEARTQLATLKLRERELMMKRTDSSKAVRDIREEIKDVEDVMTAESQNMRQRNLEKAKDGLTLAKNRVANLKQRLDQTDSNITALEKHTLALNELRRTVSQEEENYRTYSRKLEESLIMDDMDRRKMVAISVIEKAVPSKTPKQNRFNKENLIAGGLFGGIAGGIALALLLEFLAPGMTTPVSAEKRLGLPVLIAVADKGKRG